MADGEKICIAGAGSIGCFVGGMMAAASRNVAMLARPRIIGEVEANGLRVTSYEGTDHRLAPAEISFSAEPSILDGSAFVLVTVKSDDTGAVADQIAAHVKPGATVVSLQNGVGNVPLLKTKLPHHRVLAGMVPFNVTAQGNGHFHRATSGDILIDADDENTGKRLSVPGLALRPTENMTGVQWGKLLINLNNALNALSGLPLQAQFAQREWRKLFADQIAEALPILKACGIEPVATTPLPSWTTPHILRLPDFAFTRIAASMVKIDPKARSSMWEDLQHRRRTEIDHLQGMIVKLAAQTKRKAPKAEAVTDLIKRAEAAAAGPPGLTPADIRAAISTKA